MEKKLPQSVYDNFKHKKILETVFVSHIEDSSITNDTHDLFLLKCDLEKDSVFIYLWSQTDWGWDSFQAVKNLAYNNDVYYMARWNAYQNYLNGKGVSPGNVCPKCKHPVKERTLFMSKFVGCMC